MVSPARKALRAGRRFYDSERKALMLDDGVNLRELGNPVGVDVSRRCVHFEDFLGKNLNVTDSVWGTKDTSASGAPTLAIVADAACGHYRLAMSNTNEAQILTLYWNDELEIDIDSKPIFEIRAKVGAAVASGSQVAFGLASAQNDTLNSVAEHMWFRAENATNLLLETDDGTTDNDDKDSGVAMSTGWREYKIDCSSKSAVRFFYRDTLGGAWIELLPAGMGAFDASAYSGNLQPFVQILKAANTNTDGIDIDYIRVSFDRS